MLVVDLVALKLEALSWGVASGCLGLADGATAMAEAL